MFEGVDFGEKPRNCNTGAGNSHLGYGVDTLHLSYYGILNLDRLSSYDSSRELLDDSKRLFDIWDLTYQLLPHGMGRFYYVFKNDYFLIKVSRKNSSFVSLSIQVKSYAFNHLGEDVFSAIEKIRDFFFLSVERVSVSRLDLYCDFQTREDMQLLNRMNVVSRSSSVAFYYDSVRLSGVVVGAGREISFRLYNKTLEAAKMGKEWSVKRYYDLPYYEPSSLIWRAEFQIKTVQSIFEGFTYENMRERFSEIWSYLTKKWLRFSAPCGDRSHTTRWRPLSWWAMISAQFGDCSTLSARRVCSSKPDISAKTRQYISSLAALSVHLPVREYRDVFSLAFSQGMLYSDSVGETFEDIFNRYRERHAAKYFKKVKPFIKQYIQEKDLCLIK